MAQYINMAAGKAVIRNLAVALLCGGSLQAAAQALTDPTRPPAVVNADAQAGEVATGPVLQSILISSHRAEAIINGRTVKAGDKVGEATVVRITESEVLLRNGREQQALKLFPNIEKQPGRGAATPQRAKGGNKGTS
ncbi:MAG TPA: MSHA biogenesis protein MshK [Noviherbaspirillum sp.]|uniref:MSHA biogenesis protein MshK n=1 Tax=Noviherbaspirillum sp. TaxID=1926288 RepID=UPI002B458D3E|nr:MSHA biogenesis protein MshK [Noviherbaspirillum sp.]HJV85658.1 MSHA biogenesis protein MshK [Noviherbaspirillum sp.]